MVAEIRIPLPVVMLAPVAALSAVSLSAAALSAADLSAAAVPCLKTGIFVAINYPSTNVK